jgi:hypothetical protein
MGLLAGLAPEVWHKDTTYGGEVNVGAVLTQARSRFLGTKRGLATRSAAGARASWPGIGMFGVALFEGAYCHGSLDKMPKRLSLSAIGFGQTDWLPPPSKDQKEQQQTSRRAMR